MNPAKQKFRRYLSQQGYRYGTMYAYSNALGNKISGGVRELLGEKIEDLYEIADVAVLRDLYERYFKVPEVAKMDEVANHLYRNAFRRYIEFCQSIQSVPASSPGLRQAAFSYRRNPGFNRKKERQKRHPWTRNDDIIAFYLYRHGDERLPLSLPEIGERLGMGEVSLRMRLANLKAIDGRGGLNSYSRLTEAVYREFCNQDEPTLRKQVEAILKGKEARKALGNIFLRGQGV